MNAATLFIADCHLNDQQPEIYQRFKTFLNDKAQDARALYILGDLFEYYLGDDFTQGVIGQVRDDLYKLVSTYKTKCYFMAGNRDFLLANDFAMAAQLQIILDSSTIQLDNTSVILSHGDHLCTDDVEYQKTRTQLRSPQWQQWFLNLAIDERIEFAKQARVKSKQHTQSSDSRIMDVNSDAVKTLFSQHPSCTFLLHGHTHRPAFHKLTVNNSEKQRMVLGDWQHHSSLIEYKNNSFQLLTY